MQPVASLDAFQAKFDLPFVVVEQAEDIKKWLASVEVQLALATWGSQYKSSAELKNTGRSQVPLLPKAGKVPTDFMYAKIASNCQSAQVAAEKLPNGGSVVKSSWLYGYAPSMCDGSLTPYGLGMVKVLAEGKVDTMLAPCKELFDAMKTYAPKEEFENLTLGKLGDFFLDADVPMLHNIAQTCPIEVVSLIPGSVLYVPMGWMLFEHAVGQLVYGARKSFVIDSVVNKASLGGLIEVYKHIKKDVKNVEAVYNLMEAQA